MNYAKMIIKPFMSMWENIALVLPATVFSIGLSIITALHELVQVEAILVIGLLIMVFIDFIAGMYKAYMDGRIITSVAMRQTSIKIIEYTMVCTAFVVMTNMTSELEFLKKVPFVFLAMIETRSIVENLSDKKGALNALFDHIKSLMADRKL
jgi:phage-related holin